MRSAHTGIWKSHVQIVERVALGMIIRYGNWPGGRQFQGALSPVTRVLVMAVAEN